MNHLDLKFNDEIMFFDCSKVRFWEEKWMQLHVDEGKKVNQLEERLALWTVNNSVFSEYSALV